MHSSLLSAAALLQALCGEREPADRPEFGALGVPLPVADGDLVIARSLTPSAVSTALGVKDLADVPAAIAAQQVAESRQRASTRSEPALTRENSPMTRGRPLCYNGIAALSSARHGASSPEPADRRWSITVVPLAWLRCYVGR